MRKFTAVIIIASLAAGVFTGCGSKSDNQTSVTSQTVTEAATADVTEKTKQTDSEKESNEMNTSEEYEIREIYCDNNGKKIYGEAYIPKADGKYPLVITSHGLGSNHTSGTAYADKLAEKNIAVYCFDFCGGSSPYNENKSDGVSTEMSVITESTDLNAVIDDALTWDFVDKDKIFLLGGSQGGLVSAITGLKRQDDIKGLILLYPAFSIYDSIHDMYSDQSEIPESSEIFGSITVGKKYATDLWDYDVRTELKNFKKPVLIVQGTADTVVDKSVAEEAAKLYSNCELKLIEGAGHGFSGENLNEAAKYIEEYLDTQLE